MLDTLRQRFRAAAPAVDFCSLRYIDTRSRLLEVRQGVADPVCLSRDRGVMVVVVHGGGYGYAATADLSESGLRAAFASARDWAARTAAYSVFDFSKIAYPHPRGRYLSNSAPAQTNDAALLDLLQTECMAAHIDARIVERRASLALLEVDELYLTPEGGDVEQHFNYVIPGMMITAHADSETQTRSLGGQYNGYCQQGGLEILVRAGLNGAGRRVATEALELLTAPDCPNGRMDLLLNPEQMMLQLHESVGHPLELDRILGDERNYAGTSFVTLDMFGNYRYGSDLLNVTFDPSVHEEFASAGWDHEGAASEKVWLIKDGMLQRPLGGQLSAARASAVAGRPMTGLANSRASNWNRPPIDRMANINIEPGTQSFQQLVAGVERGVLMETNVSWSIDDSRNKFQFSCERGHLIENGEIKGVVKNPGYRGISATFWRALKGVGDGGTLQVMGTPYCGKGEPNQVVRVGHASPACLFGDVEVFGGAA